MSDISHHQAFVAQFALTMVYTVGFFAIIILMMLGYMRVPAESRDAFVTLLGVLATGQAGIGGYWFSRQRQTTGAADPHKPAP